MFKKALFIAALSGAILTTGALTPAHASARHTCDINVSKTDDLNAFLDASPAGATICIDKGIHSLSNPLMPKNGQSILGADGAVLSGSRVLGPFEKVDDAWIADAHTPSESRGKLPLIDDTTCAQKNYQGCKFRNAVFLDNAPLWRVMSRSEVAPGRFFFDFKTDLVYIGDNPNQREVDVATVSQAIVAGSSTNVTINGLIVEKFANRPQTGAISGGIGWTVSNNEVRLNHGVGLCVGSNSRVLTNYVHHNGQMGMCGTGVSILVEGNEISYNNSSGFSSLWEAGGTKWVETDGLTVRDNFAHHNNGPGLWTDINNINTTYEGNVVEDNAGPGIIHEISYAATIHDNEISRNGFGYSFWAPAGILIIDSPDVEVASNTLRGNRGGVAILQDDRMEGRYGSLQLRNVRIHDNSISTKGWSGFQSWTKGGSQPIVQADVRFQRNEYEVSQSDGFYWGQKELGIKGWKRIGQDRTGTFAVGSV